MIERYLNNIMDVPGTEGICLLGRDGRLLVNQMPDFIIPEVFDNLSRRIMALYEAIDEHFIACDDYLLKYPQKWIFLRRTEHSVLVVMTDLKVNVMSLRMVTNMALKNITSTMLADLLPKAPPPSSNRAPAPAIKAVAMTQPVPPEPVVETPEKAPGDTGEQPAPTRNRVARLERPTNRSYRGQSY